MVGGSDAALNRLYLDSLGPVEDAAVAKARAEDARAEELRAQIVEAERQGKSYTKAMVDYLRKKVQHPHVQHQHAAAIH
jgi:hypothetical protein